MKRTRLSGGLFVLLWACLALVPVKASAQGAYPERPIRLVVPFAPGGDTNIMGRKLGAQLTTLLGQQWVIDNKTGAGGTVGTAEVARAKPDGYTLILGTSSTHTIAPLTMNDLPYAPVIDRLYRATIQAMDDTFQKEPEQHGIEAPADTSPARAAQLVRDEIAKWAPVVKRAGVKPN